MYLRLLQTCQPHMLCKLRRLRLSIDSQHMHCTALHQSSIHLLNKKCRMKSLMSSHCLLGTQYKCCWMSLCQQQQYPPGMTCMTPTLRQRSDRWDTQGSWCAPSRTWQRDTWSTPWSQHR